MNDSEEAEEIKTFPLPLPAARIAGLAQLMSCQPISVRRPSDVRDMTRLSHPTTPNMYCRLIMSLQAHVCISLKLALFVLF